MVGEIIPIQIDKDLEDLIPGFLQNRHKDVTLITNALKESDFELLRSVGHKMKGNSGGYGFDKLSEIGARLEIAGKESNAEIVATCLDEIIDYLERIEITFVEEE